MFPLELTPGDENDLACQGWDIFAWVEGPAEQPLQHFALRYLPGGLIVVCFRTKLDTGGQLFPSSLHARRRKQGRKVQAVMCLVEQ